jgi:hypothetical protein
LDSLASTGKIAVGTDRSATLVYLKVVEHVGIAYDQKNGALVAHHIAEAVPHKSRGKEAWTAFVQPPVRKVVAYES